LSRGGVPPPAEAYALLKQRFNLSARVEVVKLYCQETRKPSNYPDIAYKVVIVGRAFAGVMKDACPGGARGSDPQISACVAYGQLQDEPNG
jgi:hypothetical protein